MAIQSIVPPLVGRFEIDPGQQLPGLAGGLVACAARDRLEPAQSMMAVRLQAAAPARAEIIAALAAIDIPGLSLPRAAGPHADEVGRPAGFLVSQAPPGTALLGTLCRWSEAEIVHCVLRPAAAVLLALAQHRVTHRAIRPDNLFRIGAGQPVTLGCAWASPPAALQPALYEPPGSAMCAPAARGNGLIADDVYALGVLLLTLCLGRAPLPGLDDAAILERKLQDGSHAALTDGERIPPMIFDLTRGMLAEDPEHRPPPALLLDPFEARARRVAARPPRKAQRGLVLADETIWHARALGGALGRHPEEAARQLRSNAVDRWLRHALGDATQAIRIDELVHQRNAEAPAEDGVADAILVMRAVVTLDTLAPLWWRGTPLWPDALGPMLAQGGFDDVVQELIGNEIAAAWGAMAPERNDSGMLQIEGRRLRALLRQRGAAGGLDRLRYLLNPLLPCASPLLDGAWVIGPADLLTALEQVAGRPSRPAHGPIDPPIAAFLVARMPHGADGEIARMEAGAPAGSGADPNTNMGATTSVDEGASLAQLRVLARLQDLAGIAALPKLAAWFVDLCQPIVAKWASRKRQVGVAAALPALIAQGQLRHLLPVFDDPARDEQDLAARQAARAQVDRIDRSLKTLRDGRVARQRRARATSGRIAVGLGAATLAAMLVSWAV